MRSHETSSNSETVPSKIRWLAIAAGVVSGIAGSLPFGPVYAFIPSLLILGAIIQPYIRRPGRWLLHVGALLVSFYVALFLLPAAVGIIWTALLRSDSMLAALLLLDVLSVVLISWCDFELVIEARQRKRFSSVAERATSG